MFLPFKERKIEWCVARRPGHVLRSVLIGNVIMVWASWSVLTNKIVMTSPGDVILRTCSLSLMEMPLHGAWLYSGHSTRPSTPSSLTENYKWFSCYLVTYLWHLALPPLWVWDCHEDILLLQVNHHSSGILPAFSLCSLWKVKNLNTCFENNHTKWIT